MKKIIGVVCDQKYFKHQINRENLECPKRLEGIYEAISRPPYLRYLKYYAPRMTTDEELLSVHSQFYLDQITECCTKDDPYSYDKDTYLMKESLSTAKLAAGGCIVLADAILTEEIDRGFALIRPPGHHAESGRGLGFCIINNVAITAQYLINKYKLDRILIVDFDVHHANGTQEIFYGTDKVLLLSIHQKSLFPFTGKACEFGEEKGYGYNINIPVSSQFSDVEYNYLFGKVIQNIAEQYLPQIILVSAGFDAHVNEHISQTCLTTKGYKNITDIMKCLANEFCGGRLLYVLEGGYCAETLKETVLATIHSLGEETAQMPGIAFSSRAYRLIKNELISVIKGKWTIL